MRYNIYSIHDKVSGHLNDLFLAVNDNVAIRTVKNTVERMKEQGVNPDDIEIYRLGAYDTEIKDGVKPIFETETYNLNDNNGVIPKDQETYNNRQKDGK